MPSIINGITNDYTAAPEVIPVYLWELGSDEHSRPEVPAETEALIHRPDGVESVVGPDDRKPVLTRDVKPNGRYRSIVKLFLRFEGQSNEDPWAMATGWLIRPDLMVTAGHCAFDHSHDLGRLTNVKAYIGYAGKESIDKPEFDVQFRTAKHIVTTRDWFEKGEDEGFDLSFIQLDRPFDNVTPIKYTDTPPTGTNLNLGVVGYPGDLANPRTAEKGALMWYMFQKTTVNLGKSRTNPSSMLQYEIDTYGGNSGSPVFHHIPGHKGDALSIGVHVYGGNINSASVIGPRGNVFDVYLAALDAYSHNKFVNGITFGEKDVERPWLNTINVPSFSRPPINGGNGGTDGGTKPSPDKTNSPPSDDTESGGLDEFAGLDESLLSVLKPALSVVNGINRKFGPFHGPQPVFLKSNGIAAGALTAISLSVAGKEAASHTGTEADLEKVYSHDGVVEQAILAEAALCAVDQLDPEVCREEGIFGTMTGILKTLAPTVLSVAPKIIGAVAGPTLQMVLNSAKAGAEAGFVEERNPVRKRKGNEHSTKVLGHVLSKQHKEFVDHWEQKLAEHHAQNPASQEGFLDVINTIGGVIGKGLQVAGPILGSVLQGGLTNLLGGVETGFVQPTPSFNLHGLAHRAAASQAALQAFLEMPVGKLERLKIKNATTGQEEGLFDFMTGVVNKYGPLVIKHAPTVISTVSPIVRDLMAKRNLAQSSSTPGGTELFQNAQSGIYILSLNPDIQGWKALDTTQWAAFHAHMQSLHTQSAAAIAATFDDPLHSRVLGAETVYFAITGYRTLVANALVISNPPVSNPPWDYYLNLFSVLTATGTAAQVTPHSVILDYQSLNLDDTQPIYDNVVPPGTPNTDATRTIWFWAFVLSAIESPVDGVKVVGQGPARRVRLTSHIQAAAKPPSPKSWHHFPYAGGVRSVTMTGEDYVKLLKDMMTNFTRNVWPTGGMGGAPLTLGSWPQ